MNTNQLMTALREQLPANEAWWNSDECRDESAKYLIDTETLVETWLSRAEWHADKLLTIDEVEQVIALFGGKEVVDNSYNYSGHLTREIAWRMVSREGDAEPVLFACKVHRGGDVRGNYTDWVLMRFESWYDWADTITEVEGEASFTITADGADYEITPQALCEYCLACSEHGDSTELYLDDLTDEACRSAIREQFV